MTTAGTAEKRAACLALGADVAVDYREQDFVEVVRRATDGRGADVILDNMGAKYLDRNVDALATEGRLVVIGMQGGTKAELDISKLLRKRGGGRSPRRCGRGRSRRSRRSAPPSSSTCGRWWPTAWSGRWCTAALPLDGRRRRARAHGVRASTAARSCLTL